MLLTKECDYGLRIIRALGDGEKKTVKVICEQEHVPYKYAYKILKKLQKAGLVKNKLGPKGGYLRAKALDQFSIYDVVSAVDERLFLSECLRGDSECLRNTTGHPCKVHGELSRLQAILIAEMKTKSIEEIFGSQ